MEWILCNSCCINVVNKKFYFTQCGHVYCCGCIVTARLQCLQCGKSDVASIDCNGQLDFDKINQFFETQFDSDTKLVAMENFDKAQLKILEIQTKNVNDKFKRLSNTLNPAAKSKNEFSPSKYNHLRAAYSNLRRECETLETNDDSEILE